MSVKSMGVIASIAERDRQGWDDATRGNASWFTLFSSDMTPTTSMSAGIMEIPPNGGTLEPHHHPQAEIYFVAEGAGLLSINGIETRITTGMAAFISGHAEHSLRNDSSVTLRIFYVFATDCFADVVYLFPSKAN
jgi:mannose-6-phosphate isomerase-like protein (cupin superfamily)